MVKMQDIKIIIKLINNELKNYTIDIQKRYDYYGIDLYDNNNNVRGTLATGHKKDIYVFLNGVYEGIKLHKYQGG